MGDNLGPQLVGRDQELGLIDQTLAQARHGVATLVLRGEVGVGLSRLVEEASARAATAGFRTVHTTSSAIDRDLGWSTLVMLLRPLLLGRSPGMLRSLTEGLGDLARILPALGPPAPSSGDLDLDRIRLCEAVRTLFTRLTRNRPLFLAIDDVEDADSLSLAALLYVVRASPEIPLALVIAAHDLGHTEQLFRALRRHPASATHDVAALDRAQVAAMIGELLNADADPGVLQYVGAQVGGSPLLVRAIIGTLLAAGTLVRSADRWVLTEDAAASVPAETFELARRRLDRLEADQRVAVDLIALAGGRLEHLALVRALRRVAPPVDAESTIAGVSSSSLVETESDLELRYRLGHPVLVKASPVHLSPTERRRLHAALAHAIEDEQHLDRKAVHVAQAGDLLDHAWAADVLTAALERAVQRAAGEAAVRHADAAVLRLHALGIPTHRPGDDDSPVEGESTDATLLDLARRILTGRARALELTGAVHAAAAAWQKIAVQARNEGRLLDEADAVLRLARIEAEDGHPELAHARLETLYDSPGRLLLPIEKQVEVLDSALAFAMRHGAVDPLRLTELTALAARSGSETAHHRARLRRIQLAFDEFDLHAVHKLARELRSTDPELIRAAQLFFVEWGDPRSALRALDVAIHRARLDRRPVVELRLEEPRLLGLVRCGEWSDAFAEAQRVQQLAERVGSARGIAFTHMARGLALVLTGAVAAARDELAAMYAAYPPASGADLHLVGYADLLQGYCDLASGRPDAVTHRAARRRTQGAQGLSLIREGYLQYGEALCRTKDLGGLAQLIDRLEAGRLDLPAATCVLDRLRGWLARERGDAETAATQLAHAAQAATDLGLRHEAATCWLDWAELVAPDEAAPLVTRELATLTSLGAKPAATRARRLLRRQSAEPTGAPPRRGATDLTARELQIATLVAEGLTDSAIAARLVLSPRTVTTHLQHAYRRLGLPGRAALTRYLLEHHDLPNT